MRNKFIPFVFIVSAFISLSISSIAQSWQYVGKGEDEEALLFEDIFANTVLKVGPSGMPIMAYGNTYWYNVDRYRDYSKTSVLSFNGSNWALVGGSSFKSTYFQSLVISPSGMPVVAFKDFVNGSKTNVVSFNGSNWNNLGEVGIANYLSLDFDSSGFPILILQDSINGGTVKSLSYDNNEWSVLSTAPGISTYSPENKIFVISPNGTPVVAYTDATNDDKITVLSLSGTNWIPLGDQGIGQGSNPNLAFSPSGMPVLTYLDYYLNNKITVLSFNGFNWSVLGTKGIGKGTSDKVDLVFNSSGVPIILNNENNSYLHSSAKVLSFDGSNWSAYGGDSLGSAAGNLTISPAGNPVLSFGLYGVISFNGSNWSSLVKLGVGIDDGIFTSLAFSDSGAPYLVYSDFQKIKVSSLDGNNLKVLGNNVTKNSFGRYSSLAISPNGIPIVAFSDDLNNSKIDVLSFDGSNWSAYGGESLNLTYGINLKLAFNPSGIPLLVYSDKTNGYKATVLSFNGINWTSLGREGIIGNYANNNNLVFDHSGNPIIMYEVNEYNNDNKTYRNYVLSFDGIKWTSFDGINLPDSRNASIAISPSGMPIIAYKKSGYNELHVVSYDGNNLINLGNEYITAIPMEIKLAISPSGMPVIAHCDSRNISVLSFNGINWSSLTRKRLNPIFSSYLSLKFNPVSGEPWVAYKGLAGATFVQRYCPNCLPINSLDANYSFEYGEQPFSLGIITATSGMIVPFQSSNINVASINGTDLIIRNVGITTITAHKLGESVSAKVNTVSIVTVNPVPLLVTVQNSTKIYGEPDPIFKCTVLGSVTGDVFNISYIVNGSLIIPVVTSESLNNYTLTKVAGILTVIPVAGINNDLLKNGNSEFYNIYPNPSNSSFSIEYLRNGISDFTIYSMEGKVLLKDKLQTGNKTIHTNLPKGLYIIKVDEVSKKLVIE